MNNAPLPPLKATGKLHIKKNSGDNWGMVENTQYIQLEITIPLI